MTLSEKTITEIRKIVEGVAGNNVHVSIFGSRARGDATFGSDIDVGVERADGLPLSPGVLTELKEAFDNAKLVERVDVVDLVRANDSFKSAIARDRVPL